MEKIYLLKNSNGLVIAAHKNLKVVQDFKRQIKDDSTVIVKIKDKNILKKNAYYDFYLVKHGHGYIPTKYYDEADLLNNEEIYNYQQVVDMIRRELEFNGELSKAEIKMLEKAFVFFIKRVDEIKDSEPDYENCKKFNELRREYECRWK